MAGPARVHGKIAGPAYNSLNGFKDVLGLCLFCGQAVDLDMRFSGNAAPESLPVSKGGCPDHLHAGLKDGIR